MPESTFEKIIRKTGNKPSSCKCQKCKQQCQVSPCLGTPEDIKKLVAAGFSERLAPTQWAHGMLIGVTDKPVHLVAPIYDQDKGACTFFENGLCQLHELGLKPTEGRLSHHVPGPTNFVPKKCIGWNVAKEWVDAGWTEERVENYLVSAAVLQAFTDSAKLFQQERQEAHDRFTKLFARPAQKPAEENY